MNRACRSVLDMLVTPLQERMDDWKKVAVQLDKEHSKGNLCNHAVVVILTFGQSSYCWLFSVEPLSYDFAHCTCPVKRKSQKNF